MPSMNVQFDMMKINMFISYTRKIILLAGQINFIFKITNVNMSCNTSPYCFAEQ